MILVKSNLCFAPLAILLLTIFDFSTEKSIIDIEKQIDSAIINEYDTHSRITDSCVFYNMITATL